MESARHSTPPSLLGSPAYRLRLQQPVADWSQLPYDLTASIANHLDTVEDFIAFSAVCKSWRLVYLEKNWIPMKRIPWLMLGESHHNNAPMRQCFSMTRSKVYNLPKLKASDCRYWGSCHGWVVTVSKGEMYLLNPINQNHIKLPSESALHANGSFFDIIHRAYVFKVVQCLVVVAIYGPKYSLAFVRVGDSEWSTVQSSSPAQFCNVVCFEDRILALSMVGNIYLLDINGPGLPSIQSIASRPSEENWQQLYLVESSGSLLMVVYYESEQRSTPLVKFKVFRFDFSHRKWVSLEDLGDFALVVDDHHCTSVPGDDFLQPNCIYYAKDNLDNFLACQRKYIGNYMFVYNLKDKNTDLHNVGNNSLYSCPTWFIPDLW
ncbi:F-box protein SKIP23-like [Ipomoea triloba]|uniref:F-box protein SKIP23-like n=1 Tax=Ipomoea triloba TaxID=35885 RepID=UPI00125D1678|nr:F-box protein SKIP23-like [Ipomoea triloba]